jgi:hypothetical protein
MKNPSKIPAPVPDPAQATTYEIIDSIIELQEWVDYPELRPEDITDEEISEGLEKLGQLALRKADNIHWVLAKLDENESALNGMLETHRNYVKTLVQKKQSMHNAKERLRGLIMITVDLIGTANKSGNLQLKTLTDSYTVVNGDGKLEITDESKIPTQYLKLTQSIDRKELRNHVIEKGGATDCAIVPKKKRLHVR